jgi:hypothetical protein
MLEPLISNQSGQVITNQEKWRMKKRKGDENHKGIKSVLFPISPITPLLLKECIS